MTVRVRGKNLEVTPALKDYVEKKVETITKQFKTVGEITAVMRIERNKHIVEITVPASGIVLRAQEGSENMYASIDNCVEKIERQIHKYKTRLMKRKYNNFRDAAVPPVSGDVEEASADGEFQGRSHQDLCDAPHECAGSHHADEHAEPRLLRLLQ